jgi:hypothetical protein
MLDQALRMMLAKDYDEGHRPLGVFKQNGREAFLDTASRRGQDDLKDLKVSLEIPSTVRLRARMIPEPLETLNVKMTFLMNQAEESFNFYDLTRVEEEIEIAKNSLFRSIRLYYEGRGVYEYAGKDYQLQGLEDERIQVCLGPNNLIMTKPFFAQKHSLKERRSYLREGRWLVTAPFQHEAKVNLRCLLGYGGYYKPGLPLDSIQPVYTLLNYEEDRPTLAVRTKNQWRKKGIMVNTGTHQEGRSYQFFQEPSQKGDHLTVAAAIKSGKALFKLYNRGWEEGFTYTSFSYDEIDLENGFIDVLFRPFQE